MFDLNLWKHKRVVVTGGAGFLGSHIMNRLDEFGCEQVAVPRSSEYDLTDVEAIRKLYKEVKPHIVIHLAAVVGGIGANRHNPGKFFYENAIMGIQLIEEARQHNIEKFVALGTICAYPKYAPVPFQEDDLWNGYPEETNAPYGLAKKMMLVQSQAYRQQYGYNSIYLLPVNLYGPKDNFDLETSHVIPAMIRKCVEAIERGDEEITLWGTGEPSREFLYVQDAADGILLATEKYNSSEPLNLGTNHEISIAKLATKIARACEYKGKIIWDTSQPDGQPRRCLDITRAQEQIGFAPAVSLDEGIQKTVAWYKREREKHEPGA